MLHQIRPCGLRREKMLGRLNPLASSLLVVSVPLMLSVEMSLETLAVSCWRLLFRWTNFAHLVTQYFDGISKRHLNYLHKVINIRLESTLAPYCVYQWSNLNAALFCHHSFIDDQKYINRKCSKPTLIAFIIILRFLKLIKV